MAAAPPETGSDEPSLEAWLAAIGASEALATLQAEEFETVASLRDIQSCDWAELDIGQEQQEAILRALGPGPPAAAAAAPERQGQPPPHLNFKSRPIGQRADTPPHEAQAHGLPYRNGGFSRRRRAGGGRGVLLFLINEQKGPGKAAGR